MEEFKYRPLKDSVIVKILKKDNGVFDVGQVGEYVLGEIQTASKEAELLELTKFSVVAFHPQQGKLVTVEKDSKGNDIYYVFVELRSLLWEEL